jgi:SAM-dependent methyltransferase
MRLFDDRGPSPPPRGGHVSASARSAQLSRPTVAWHNTAMDSRDGRWVGAMAETYDRCLGRAVFLPFAVDMAQRAARLSPGRVLEVAAGTGVLTACLVAALPDAQVTATDLNAAMVDVGASRVPEAAWRSADASHLPFPDATVDLVVCQFGVMFFPDRPAAWAEAARVLVPGGRLLFNTWGPVATHGFARVLLDGLERAFPGDVPPFVSAVPHGYSDLDLVAADVRAGGLEVLSVDTVTLEGRADSAAQIAAGFCAGTPTRGEIEARGDLAATIAIVGEEMTAQWGEGPVTTRMTAHVVEARRSADTAGQGR